MKMLPNGKSYSKLLQYKPIDRKKRNIFSTESSSIDENDKMENADSRSQIRHSIYFVCHAIYLSSKYIFNSIWYVKEKWYIMRLAQFEIKVSGCYDELLLNMQVTSRIWNIFYDYISKNEIFIIIT